MSESTENDTPQAQFKLPQRGYKVAIRECVKKLSKQGKPMLEMTVELADNPPVSLADGTAKDVNGIEIRHWVSLTPEAIEPFNRFNRACGMPTVSLGDLPAVDPELYKGRSFYCVAGAKAQEMKDEEGNIVTHPVTGNPIMTYNKRINSILQPDGQ